MRLTRRHPRGPARRASRPAAALAALTALAAGAVALLPLAAAPPALSADWKVVEDAEWCDDDHDSRTSFCEVRETTLPARELLSVDGGANGGIRVEAWDRDEIRVRAQVRIWRADPDDVDALAEEIEIRTDDDLRATGPSRRGRASWSVSYRILVPARTDLSLEANNGGITVTGVTGDIDLETNNGGLRLADLGGDVLGRTRNGGIDVRLAGSTWNGDGGLDLETRNGGIELDMPQGYSADLELETVNGGIRSDVLIRGEGKRSRRIRAVLGEGGPRVRIVTTNGGISVRER